MPQYDLVSPMAGEIFYASSVLSALLLFGLAVFFFVFGALPYWFKVHKSLKEILGCWAVTFPNGMSSNTLDFFTLIHEPLLLPSWMDFNSSVCPLWLDFIE